MPDEPLNIDDIKKLVAEQYAEHAQSGSIHAGQSSDVLANRALALIEAKLGYTKRFRDILEAVTALLSKE